MHDVVAIGYREFVLGFRSAGVKGIEVQSPKEAKEVISKIVAEESAAVIFLGESVAEEIIDYVEKVSSSTLLPSILVIRDERSNKGIGKESIKRYIEQATGMSTLVGE